MRPRLFVVIGSCLAIVCIASVGLTKGSKFPVVGVVTGGIAERLHTAHTAKKSKKKTSSDVGKTFSAICDGQNASYQVTELADDGAWVGKFTGGGGARHAKCMLVDSSGPNEPSAARPTPSAGQLSAAKIAATSALTPKHGDAPKNVEITVWNDGVEFIAVAQSSRPAGEKSSCLDRSSLVIMAERGGAWKTVFKPTAKSKDTCGYTFFTRGDVDHDGRDEIALRVDLAEGYAYRILKAHSKTYTVAGK
jgi:hypothetical protein